ANTLGAADVLGAGCVVRTANILGAGKLLGAGLWLDITHVPRITQGPNTGQLPGACVLLNAPALGAPTLPAMGGLSSVLKLAAAGPAAPRHYVARGGVPGSPGAAAFGTCWPRSCPRGLIPPHNLRPGRTARH